MSGRTFLRHLGKRASQHTGAILIVCTCLGLGVLTSMLSSDTNGRSASASDSWTLPNLEKGALASNIDVMMAEPLFGGEPVVIEIEKPDSDDEEIEPRDTWLLVGIFSEGNTKHIVILNESTGKTELAQLGQLLPGGELLTAIGPNEIEISDTDEKKILSLFVDIPPEGIAQ